MTARPRSAEVSLVKPKNRLVVYSIKQEKARLGFEAAVEEIGPAEIILSNHALAFDSDKSPRELFEILVKADTGVDPSGDEFYIFTTTDQYGFGDAITYAT